MLSLKNHPFAVEAFFEKSLVLSYAVPKNDLSGLIPPCLELDTLNDQWAFVAVALVKTKKLRPKGFPGFLGNDFILMGFRIFVKYTNNEHKRMRGLYILKSETNKKKMSILGNIFSQYNYTTTDISYSVHGGKLIISSQKSDLDIEADLHSPPVSPPENSPFKDWKEARHFAGPLPFTFTYNNKTKEVLIIEGVRKDWVPKPVEIVRHKAGFINKQKFPGIVLANAFIIENIPYYWKKGRIEVWNG